jgi:hypothetical protein
MILAISPGVAVVNLSLTLHQNRLVDTGRVEIVDKTTGQIPDHRRSAILRGFGGNFSNKGLACTLLREDGKVLIVVDGDVTSALLRHEFIHAAQCFAGEETMASCLAEAVAKGSLLAEAIRRAVAVGPELAHAHRDYVRTVDLWRSHANGSACSTPMVDFEFYQDLFPTAATAALAADVLGFDYSRGAYAALTASICAEVGITIDPSSDMAREIVAYAFEALEADVIDDLLEEASDVAEARTSSDLARPLPGFLRR